MKYQIMKYLYYVIMTFFVVFCSIPLAAEDSIPATNLEELVVKSERSWIENGVVNIIPSKKEKKLSTSPGTLIEIMHLPMLKGEGDLITTSSNEAVDIFINGEPANQTDIATFWPKDVKKVEYMVNPTGGQYTGRRHVVNFVVADYAVGGVTKIYVSQSFPLRGSYNVSSKLNYKKMSYGLLLNYYDKRIGESKTQEEATYKNIFYNGVRYDEIKQTSYGEEEEKWDNLNLAFNARYATDKIKVTHTFGLRWNRDILDASTSSLWTENLFNSESFSSYSKNKSLSPQLTGRYHIVLSTKWNVGGQWSYAYSSNYNDDWAQFGENPRIDNEMKEKVNTASLMAYVNYYLSQKLIFQLMVNSDNKWFSSDYSGSLADHLNQFREELNVKFSVFWYPSPKLTFVVAPGMTRSEYKYSGMHINHTQPSLYGFGRWSPNRKLSMYFNIISLLQPASAGETNPVVTQVNDLMWLTGNPQLKPAFRIFGSYSVIYMPCDWLSLSPFFSYDRKNNTTYYMYEAAPEEMGGVIRTTVNASPSDDLSLDINAAVKLFNNRLSISAAPRVRYFKARGEYAGSLTNFSIDANAGFILGNCYLTASYKSKNKVLSQSGNSIISQADQYSFGVSYSLSDLNISFTVQNVFKSRINFRTETFSNVYATNSYRSDPGRGVNLSLTYTFGYGKRIDRSIDIAAPTEVESSRVSQM